MWKGLSLKTAILLNQEKLPSLTFIADKLMTLVIPSGGGT
jgi:hypothetical protein